MYKCFLRRYTWKYKIKQPKIKSDILKVTWLLLLVAVCADSQNSEISRQFQDIYPDGSYEFLYETGNGIFVQEEGKARSINEENADLVVQGSFLYTAPDGKEIHLSYVADENGFRPQGDHLPTPPPIPPQIQRALDWIAGRSLQNNR